MDDIILFYVRRRSGGVPLLPELVTLPQRSQPAEADIRQLRPTKILDEGARADPHNAKGAKGHMGLEDMASATASSPFTADFEAGSHPL